MAKSLGDYRRLRRKAIDVRAVARERLAALRAGRAEARPEPARIYRPNQDWYAPGFDPDDVTGGNGDG